MKSKSAFRLVRTGSSAAYLLAGAIVALLAMQSAQAAITWNLATGGNWDASTTANWTADGGATTTTFTDDGTVDVIFGNTAGGAIVISANMSPLSTTVNATSGTYTFSGGPIDSGSLIKSNGGTLTLSAANTFSGGVTLNGGSLMFGNNTCLGTGTLTINGGITGVSAGNPNLANPVILNSNSSWINGGANNGMTLSGPVTLGGSYTLTVTQNNLTVTNTISDGGFAYGLTKAGANVLNLTGTNTYTGKTIITAGTLTGTIKDLGVTGSFGAPTTVENGTIDMYPGTALTFGSGNISSNRVINLAGYGGTMTLTPGGNNNGLTPTLAGGFTVTGTGPKTLQLLNTGNMGIMYVTGAIPNASDGSPLTLQVPWGSNHSGNTFYLNGVNTFTGPLYIGNTTGNKGAFVIGAAGQLGSGSYAGNIEIRGQSTTVFSTLTYNSSADQILSGVISGAGALNKSGAGNLTLTNANTFSGTTTVSSGTLTLSNSLALQNSALATATGNITLGGSVTTPTIGGLSGSTDLASVIAASGFNALTALTLNPQAGVIASYSGVIGDNGNTMPLIKTGAGTQVLSGTNLYTGTTTISGGALQANDGAGLPSANFLSLDGGTLQSNGASTFTRSLGTSGSTFQFTANGGGFSAAGGQLTVNIGGAAAELTWGTSVGSQIVGTLQLGSLSATAKTLFENPIDLNTATRTINVGANTAEISGVIQTSSGTAGLIKTGAGTLILSGANTYNGPTTLNAGGLTLANGSYSDGITVNGGTLTLPINFALMPTLNAGTLALSGAAGVLAYNASPILVPYGVTLLLDNTGAGNNNNDRIDNNQAITFSGGTLNYKGSDQTATDSSETVGSITLAANTASKITLTKATTGGTVTVDLQGITRNAGSMLNFNVVPDATSVVAKTTYTNTNNILGTWATVGATTTLQYAANNGSGQIVALGATGTTAATPATAADLSNMTDPAVNYSYSAAATLAGNQTGNTLRYTGAATTTALGTNSLTLNGLMNAGTNTLTISGTAGNPGLVIGANGELDIVSNDKNITISSVISGTTGTVVYSGGTATATLGLSGVNTFGGGLIVNSGTISLTAVANVLGIGSVTLMPGTTLAMSNAALSNSISITDASITSGNSFGGSLSGDITLGGVVTLALTGEGNEAISSNISGSGGLTHKGVRLDTLTSLSGTNTYTGPTTIASSGTLYGALKFTNRVSLYNANADSVSWTADKIIINPVAVAVFAVGGAGQFTSSDITILAGLGTATGGFANGSFIGLDTTTASYSCDSVIANPNGGANVLGVHKFGNNTLTLTGASAYTGQTRIYRGSLQVSSINSVATNVGLGTVHSATSNLGAPTTVADGTIIMGLYGQTGTLRYAGAGETTDRVIALNNAGGGGGSGGAIIDQSGTGLLKFTSDLSVGTLSGKTITFQGSNPSGTGEFAGAIAAIPGTNINVTKSGTGTWTLSGANSYTGITTVSGGRLLINGTHSGTGAVNVSASAALGGTGTIAGNTTVAANGKLAFNLSTAAASHDRLDITGSLTFSGASALDITTSVTPAIGVYTLVTAAGGISGVAPALNLPVDWAATASISGDGKSLLLDVTSIGAASDYDIWAAGYLPNNVSNPAADFDGDGLSNFQEYALGLNPTSGASVNPISQQLDKTTGLFKYTRRATPATTGVTYTYESSTTLSGTWPGFTPDSEVSNNATPVEEITVDVPDSLLLNPKLFLRVKALQP